MSWVYLLCFREFHPGPSASVQREEKAWYEHAGHYLGSTYSIPLLWSRLEQHLEGRGARIMEVVTNAGLSFRLSRLWRVAGSARPLERRLKNRGGAPPICPLCSGPAAWSRARAGISPSARVSKLCRLAPLYVPVEIIEIAA